MDLGLLILRLALGFTVIAHGSQKLFGWFGGHGLDRTGQFFEGLGFRQGKVQAFVAAFTEVGGGLLLVLGILVPLAAAGLIGVMLVAAISVPHKSFFIQNDGWEYLFMLAVVALVLALTGSGSLSLGAALGFEIAGPAWGGLALVVGVGGGLGALSTRRPTVDRAQPAP